MLYIIHCTKIFSQLFISPISPFCWNFHFLFQFPPFLYSVQCTHINTHQIHLELIRSRKFKMDDKLRRLFANLATLLLVAIMLNDLAQLLWISIFWMKYGLLIVQRFSSEKGLFLNAHFLQFVLGFSILMALIDYSPIIVWCNFHNEIQLQTISFHVGSILGLFGFICLADCTVLNGSIVRRVTSQMGLPSFGNDIRWLCGWK